MDGGTVRWIDNGDLQISDCRVCRLTIAEVGREITVPVCAYACLKKSERFSLGFDDKICDSCSPHTVERPGKIRVGQNGPPINLVANASHRIGDGDQKVGAGWDKCHAGIGCITANYNESGNRRREGQESTGGDVLWIFHIKNRTVVANGLLKTETRQIATSMLRTSLRDSILLSADGMDSKESLKTLLRRQWS